MKYTLKQDSFGVNIYEGDCMIGRIDGVRSSDLDDEIIEESLFGDVEEDECWID